MPVNTDPPCVWSVEPDGYPNGKWTIRNQYGCTALPNRGNYGAGFYRTTSRTKAERDCARLNAAEAKLWSEQEKADIAGYAARLRKKRGLKARNREKIGVLRRSIAAWYAVGGKPLSEYGQAAVERQEREIRARLAAEKLARTPAAVA